MALGFGAALAAAALIGKGQIAAVAVGAIAGVLVATRPAVASGATLNADLRLAVVEGEIEQHEEQIKRVLGVLEAAANA